MPADENARAVHFEGGNYFDDMRVDIAQSHQRFVNLARHARSIRKSRARNLVKLYLVAVAVRLGIYELLVVNGLRSKWLDDFRAYWFEILNGRPFWTTLEFFLLTHDYRKRHQHTTPLEWSGPAQHVAHWQHPSRLYGTLHQVRKLAVRPLVSPQLFRQLSRGMRVLEYGCSLAPYYSCYREFFSHLDCTWVLADLPNYPFHYARYLYRDDAEAEFAVIGEDAFADPLARHHAFDVIILTTVLEHVDDPLFVSDYLLDRLKPGGLFVFDYIKSEALGLDHPRALEMREACLARILARTRVIEGDVRDLTRSLGLCIARKVA